MESLGTSPKRNDGGDGRPVGVAAYHLELLLCNPHGKAGNEERRRIYFFIALGLLNSFLNHIIRLPVPYGECTMYINYIHTTYSESVSF